jgi:signal-transduction protein with cAMP-binding, CBS, and nucleotidyltransferase domain
MVEKRIGAMMVKEGDDYVGIWTERDLLRNILEPGFDPKKALIRDHMATRLKSAPHTDTIYQLLDKLLGLKIRHLLIEKEGNIIGLISKRDITRATLLRKSKEYEELNKIVSWDYYEDWKWKKKKK